MKKAAILFCLFLFSTCLLAQAPIVSYKVMSGKVGTTDVVITIHIANKKLSGYAWFINNPNPFQWNNGNSKITDSILILLSDTPVHILLKGVLSQNNFTGNAYFKKENSSEEKLPFRLELSASPGFTAFDYVFTKGKASVPFKMKDPPSATYSASAVWPKNMKDKALEKTVKEVINNQLGNKGAAKEPGKIILADKKMFFSEWKAEIADATAKDAKEKGGSFSREKSQDITVKYEDDRVLVLSSFVYEYTGGAHGNYGTDVISFDKRKSSVIKLADVFTDEGLEALPALLEESIRKQGDLDTSKTLEENGLFVNKIEPTENFYITSGGVGFIYPIYTIRAYVFGETDLFLPIAQLEKYLKAAFKK